MVDLNRRKLMSSTAAAALGASVAGSGLANASQSEIPESDTPGAPSVKGELKRFANTAFGAEVTGPYVFADGTLLFSNQHPEENNQGEFKYPGVGYFSGFQFDLDGDLRQVDAVVYDTEADSTATLNNVLSNTDVSGTADSKTLTLVIPSTNTKSEYHILVTVTDDAGNTDSDSIIVAGNFGGGGS